MRIAAAFFFALFVAFAADAQFVEAEVISTSRVTIPAEAKITGLGGTVSVLVKVDETGRVASAEEAVGPDTVCSHVTRADVAALRRVARIAALDATFRPATKSGKPVSSKNWLFFTFPSSWQAPPELAEGSYKGGRARTKIVPIRPSGYAAENAFGKVKVQIVVDERGKVFSARPMSGHPYLFPSVRSAACKTEFEPTTVDGKPVMVTGTVIYNFQQAQEP